MWRRRASYLVWDADNREYKLYDRQGRARPVQAGRRNPVARWRIAVATSLQVLTLVTVGLFLWGVVQTPGPPVGKFEALILVVPLSCSLLVLMLSAIFLGMLGMVSGRWRPDEVA